MIRIYGHSDDVVVIDNHGDLDEAGAFDSSKTITIGGEGEGLQVVAKYGKAGVWQFTLRQVDEGVDCPWPVRIERQHEYSLAVVIDCPSGTPIDWKGKGK